RNQRRPHGGGAAHRRASDASRPDDLRHCGGWIVAGGCVEWDRVASSKAACDRCCGWHVVGAHRHSYYFASTYLILIARQHENLRAKARRRRCNAAVAIELLVFGGAPLNFWRDTSESPRRHRARS